MKSLFASQVGIFSPSERLGANTLFLVRADSRLEGDLLSLELPVSCVQHNRYTRDQLTV